MTTSSLHEITREAGATFGEDAGWTMPLHFGDPEAEYRAAHECAALFDVSHHGKLDVVGRDSVSFLHNLCTADVKNLKPGAVCESFLANAKAKAVAYAVVFRGPLENPLSLWIDSGPGRGPAVFQHLDHFLISEQVELTDRTTDFAQLHLRGPDAETRLNGVLPAFDRDQIDIRQTHASHFDLRCIPDLAAALWRALLKAGASPAGLNVHEILRVEAGFPRWGAELDENRSVFEVGRNQQAICYTKGCYLGQEPIVMARDRGHINRTLLGLKVNVATPLAQGARVWHNGQDVGQVTSSVKSPRLSVIALAYLKRGSQEPGLAVEVETGPDTRAGGTVSALPFAF